MLRQSDRCRATCDHDAPSCVSLIFMRFKVLEASAWHYVIGWKLRDPLNGLIMDGLGPSELGHPPSKLPHLCKFVDFCESSVERSSMLKSHIKMILLNNI